MKPNEYVDDFSDLFLHLVYVFLGEDIDWDLFKWKFKELVHIPLHGESESRHVSTSITFVDHEEPLISEEEPTMLFFSLSSSFYSFDVGASLWW